MKIRSDFVIREVAGTWVVLPIGEASIKFNGMINLNPTAVFIWKALEVDTSLEAIAERMAAEYKVTYDKALQDVTEFVQKLVELGCVE